MIIPIVSLMLTFSRVSVFGDSPKLGAGDFLDGFHLEMDFPCWISHAYLLVYTSGDLDAGRTLMRVELCVVQGS